MNAHKQKQKMSTVWDAHLGSSFLLLVSFPLFSSRLFAGFAELAVRFFVFVSLVRAQRQARFLGYLSSVCMYVYVHGRRALSVPTYY